MGGSWGCFSRLDHAGRCLGAWEPGGSVRFHNVRTSVGAGWPRRRPVSLNVFLTVCKTTIGRRRSCVIGATLNLDREGKTRETNTDRPRLPSKIQIRVVNE